MKLRRASERDLKFFVDTARSFQRSPENREDEKIARAMNRLDSNARQFKQIGRELATLGVNIPTTNIPGLEEFWTEAGIEDALEQHSQNQNIRRLLSKGEMKMMQIVAAFVDALTKLSKNKKTQALKPDLIHPNWKDHIHLRTRDGYSFKNYVHGKEEGTVGVDIMPLTETKESGSLMATPGNDTYAQFTNANDPATGKPNTPIQTIAITRGESYKQESGGTVLMQRSKGTANSTVARTWIKGQSS